MIVYRTAHELGWLRRPEMDLMYCGFVWERPDGSLFIAKRETLPTIATVQPTQNRDFIR